MKIVFVDRSTKLESVKDLETRPRGGMVSSLFKVSDYLSQQGHDVWVLSDIKKTGRTVHGTKWINSQSETTADNRFVIDEYFDFIVSNRGVGGFNIEAKHRILWTHDLPHAGHIPEPKNIKAFSATVFMSRYAEKIWRYYYKDIGKSYYIPNGVDKDLFHPREKDLNCIIFASAPNRGLKRLPLIFDAIASRVKKPVYMLAYSDLATLHPNEVGKDDLSETYNEVRKSNVTLRKPIPQTDLAEVLGEAGLMILPSDYPEICSNIILQSLASGTPIVTTGNLGSSGEWIRHGKNGMLSQWMPHDYMSYQLNIVRDSVQILEDENLHRKLIRNAAKTDIYSWDQIGAMWNRMLERLS